ncbi:MAG: glycosyltransferase [Candidatus Omnitrophota bacterium]
MKVLVVSFYGEWGMGAYVKDALIELGHSPGLFYTNASASAGERILNRAKYLSLFSKSAHRLWEEKVNRRLIKSVSEFSPELIFVIKGEELLPQVLQEIKERQRIPLLVWLPDNPFYSKIQNIIRSLPLYDYVFSFDPGLISRIKEFCKARVEFMPLACNPRIHKKMDLSPKEQKDYHSDACFVGTASPERSKILGQIGGYDLGIWGRGWEKEGPLLKRHFKGFASGEKMVKVFNASKVALNIHHPQTVDGVNLRTFEICASGAFQLVDERSALSRLFKVGQELVCFRDTGDLKNLIDYFLKNEKERQEVAQRGYERANSEHTYEKRLKEIFRIIS